MTCFSKSFSHFARSRRGLLQSAVAIACLFCAHIPLYGAGAVVELTSPKSDDHFEVTQPLLFWNSTTGVDKYEVYIDDAKAGEMRPPRSRSHIMTWLSLSR